MASLLKIWRGLLSSWKRRSINALCGAGILSIPYAVREGGWFGIGILLIFAVFSFYTGLLLRYCLDSDPELETYPDIGQAAFGTTGRIAISIILYSELYVSIPLLCIIPCQVTF
ncbi:hypothetical protein RIF29_09819 [Crotalaria pallida]|uniref:Amino acid transporter transmembrane domain-containing protein n=1 Tax=Crotalaria pallida TaxID=3830 RepID=A0AAN9IJT3_CROPI